MFKKVFLISIFLVSIALSSSVNAFPEYEKSGEYYIIGRQRIKFGYFVSSSAFNPNNITYNVTNRFKNRLHTLKMDGSYKWKTIPMYHHIVIWWYNIDNNRIGWFAIKNTPCYWQWLTLEGSSNILSNKCSIKKIWYHNGDKFSIHFKNPENKNGWTPNDIWIGLRFN